MSTRTQYHILLLVAVIAFMSVPHTLLAQKSAKRAGDIEVLLDSPFEVQSAVGLIFSAHASYQKTDTQLRSFKDGTKGVRFSFGSRESSELAMATALVTSNGDVAFADIVPLDSTRAQEPLVGLPRCERKVPLKGAAAAQQSLIESLVEVREQRTKFMEVKIQSLMSKDFIAKLAKIENSFGLPHKKELSLELPPLELIGRLSAIIHAIKTYEYHKQRRKSATAADEG